jgi:hypothetical protein
MMTAFLLALIIVQFVVHFRQAVKHQLELLLFEVVDLFEGYLIVKLKK